MNLGVVAKTILFEDQAMKERKKAENKKLKEAWD